MGPVGAIERFRGRVIGLWTIPCLMFVCIRTLPLPALGAAMLSALTMISAGLLVCAMLRSLLLCDTLTHRRQLAWTLLFWAVVADTLANCGWAILALLRVTSYGTWIDALYLVWYPLVAACCVMLFRDLGGSIRSLQTGLDAATFALGLMASLWVVVFGSQHSTLALSPSVVYMTTAYGIANVLTVVSGAVLAMQISQWRREASTVLLLLCVVCTLVSDTTWIIAQTHGRTPEGTLTDVGYCLHYAFLGTAAALEATRVDGPAAKERETVSYNFLPIIVLMLGAALFVADTLTDGNPHPRVLTLLIMTGGVVAVIRQIFVRRDFETLHTALSRKHADQRLTELVRQSEDLLCVIAADRRLSYASPSALRLLGTPAESLHEHDACELLGERHRETLAELLRKAARAPGEPQVVELSYQRDGKDSLALHLTACDATANPAIEGVCLTVRDVSTNKRLEARLRALAFYDPLTSLANRSLFHRCVRQAIETMSQGRRPAVLFVDLDNFKHVNDALGHSAGDGLLKTCARRLTSVTGKHGTVARLGGDEFAVLLNDVQGSSHALSIGQLLADALRPPVRVDGRDLRIAASIGVYVIDRQATVDEVLRGADAAMYRAKAQGKGQAALFDPAMAEAAQKRLFIEQGLATAIQHGELSVHYQPIVDLETSHLIGVEALLRWNHPTHGLIMPGDFIPVAEETGHIVPVTEWLLRAASRDIVALKSQLPLGTGVRLFINLSGRCLQEPNLPQVVEQAIRASELEPSSLVLEITESVLLTASGEINERVAELHRLGVRLALDDFGTGFSSLSYLHRFSLDVLKIDKSFVHQLSSENATRRAEAEGLIRAILSIADSLGIEAIAEGIEEEPQREVLLKLGCRTAQGFAFGRPMAIDEIVSCRANQRRELLARNIAGEVDFSATGRFLRPRNVAG